jgi:acyl carrier protein
LKTDLHVNMERLLGVLTRLCSSSTTLGAASQLDDILKDSLERLEAVMEIEKEFGIELKADRLSVCKTVADLCSEVTGARSM